MDVNVINRAQSSSFLTDRLALDDDLDEDEDDEDEDDDDDKDDKDDDEDSDEDDDESDEDDEDDDEPETWQVSPVDFPAANCLDWRDFSAQPGWNRFGRLSRPDDTFFS